MRTAAERAATDAPVLECRSVTLGYGAEPVIRELSLAVAAGETLALLGPSGSGKTTLLYAVAGFVEPRVGEILISGEVVGSTRRRVPPERRSVGVVFQNYALWPHMTALETVAYPLRRSGIGAAEARRRSQGLLDGMGVGRLAARRPAELSGGEQQRVGLARALARDPDLYLFDEPTAHLDSALRAALQEQLAAQRRGSRAAALYATHDVAEALAVADRVALLRDGRLVQVGLPAEIYERPVDLWAARLTGPASLLDAMVCAPGPPMTLALGGLTVQVAADGATDGAADGARHPVPGPYQVLVRPGWARLGGPLTGTVRGAWYRGPHTEYHLETPGGLLALTEPGPPRLSAGEAATWTLERVWAVRESLRSDGQAW